MRIGYPCINRTINCRANRTFRLKSYSETRLIETVQQNIDCLLEMLRFNVSNDIMFFRITSDLIPFASHSINRFDWQTFFSNQFKQIGHFINESSVRISMHPDQFIIINSPDKDVYKRSLAELVYHAQVLDVMGLDTTAKIQVHIGGVYRDKVASMKRFACRFKGLPESVRRRLVIENDDRLYTLYDCISLNKVTGIPVLLDTFHHRVNCSGETEVEALKAVKATWRDQDGLPMIDYSSQKPKARKGNHAETIDLNNFRVFLENSRPFDFDVMLEIKDKEISALKAVQLAKFDERFLDK
ncbi:MAG: UV DNA damage repair endonuclease UvsE [Thermodesulfobacteriota bacterium]|nr:UV DNA damage repair endonuclease UvsE [Thermodesulfobacteriota bacterium]